MTATMGGHGAPVITFDYIERRFKDLERSIGRLGKRLEDHEQEHVDELRRELEAAKLAPRSRRLELCAVFGAIAAPVSAAVAVISVLRH